MAVRMCDVETCTNEISDGCGSKGGKPICPRCRAAMYADNKLNAKALVAKRERWHYWEDRMDCHNPGFPATANPGGGILPAVYT